MKVLFIVLSVLFTVSAQAQKIDWKAKYCFDILNEEDLETVRPLFKYRNTLRERLVSLQQNGISNSEKAEFNEVVAKLDLIDKLYVHDHQVRFETCKSL